jgi:BetI-type transcriptional repressor, C-terminal
LKTARNASERVWAVVEANFLPEILTPEFFRLWFEVLDDKRLLYILDIFERRMRTNLVLALKQLTDPREAADIAYEIMNFYDGFWALASIEPSITRKTALSQIAEFIKDVVPRFDLSVVKFDG